jgi:hypothetical protein
MELEMNNENLVRRNDSPVMQVNPLALVSEGLGCIQNIVGVVQKQKTTRKAITSATVIAVEKITCKTFENIESIWAQCENRKNSLASFSLLIQGRNSQTSEELTLFINYLLQMGLTPFNTAAVPNIDNELRIISCGFQMGEGEEAEDDSL